MIGAVVSLVVALDPIGLARTWPKRLAVTAVVAAVLVAAVLLADPVLDVLDLSPEAFWISAGIVLLVPAFGRLGRGTTHDVAGPASVLVAMAVATRDGTGSAIVAVAVASLLTLVALAFVTSAQRWVPIVERIVGAAMVVVAFDLVRDGVIAV